MPTRQWDIQARHDQATQWNETASLLSPPFRFPGKDTIQLVQVTTKVWRYMCGLFFKDIDKKKKQNKTEVLLTRFTLKVLIM